RHAFVSSDVAGDIAAIPSRRSGSPPVPPNRPTAGRRGGDPATLLSRSSDQTGLPSPGTREVASIGYTPELKARYLRGCESAGKACRRSNRLTVHLWFPIIVVFPEQETC